MRQTTEHRSYDERRVTPSLYVPTPASRTSCRRHGFTLIEVMIALVIIGLAGLGLATFSMQSYRATQDLTIRATAENLAEVTLEELGSFPGSTLYSMTHSSGYFSINFPGNGYVVGVQEAWDAAAKYNDSSAYDAAAKKFTPASGTYHVLCNGQLLLGRYDRFFDGIGRVDPGGTGAVVKTSDGTDLFDNPSWSSAVAVTGPSQNDYYSVYTPGQIVLLPSGDPSGYNVYKYRLGSGIFLEPFNNGIAGAQTWTYAGLLVFASTAPHLYREVMITDTSPSASVDNYQIRIRVIWTFGGIRQVVDVTGGKVDLR